MTSADPTLLLEASRIFNQAGDGYRVLAEIVSALALEAVDKASGEVHAAILCDAAALRLSGRVKDEIGWHSALALLDKIDEDNAGSEGVRLHILRAFANGQQYRDLMKRQHPEKPDGAAAEHLRQLRDKVVEDLRFVFARDPELIRVSRHFWDPDAPLRSRIDRFAEDQEDDWRSLYDHDKEFRDFVNHALGSKPAAARAVERQTR